MVYNNTLGYTGNTPLIKINCESDINFYVKYEGVNPSGSVKDRAAYYLLDKLLKNGEINKDTVIIESSSGNFGIALSSYCRIFGLKCTIVIDPNVLDINELIITSLATNVIKVTERDITGGFLLTRINYIKEVLKKNSNFYWANQYSNPYIAEAYKNTLGKEICDDLMVDYVFLGVSSGGTITGVSNAVKERYPNAKVIAVDSVGSVIFGGAPKKRYIPGIGSSMRPDILKKAIIDDVVMIDETEVINKCQHFLRENMMLIGGSSASVYCAVEKYFSGRTFLRKPNVVAVFADRGDRYIDTIYNENWIKEHYINTRQDHIESLYYGITS
jgi:N-(2-amino-2-carboxyethyl)-L-glutamate synthase